jgi:hypothetical protein
MKVQGLQQDKQVVGSEKQHYDPPQATFVRVELEERVLGCNYSTIKNCGLTE